MRTRLLILGMLVAVVAFLASCSNDGYDDLGEVDVRTYEQDAFTSVQLETLGNIRLHESSEYKVEIETNLALFNHFNLEVVDGELRVSSRFSNREQRSITIINIDIYAPTYTGIEMYGVSNVEARDGITTDHLELALHGVGNMEVYDINVNSIRVRQRGIGNVEVTGEATEAEYILHSTGSIEAFQLQSDLATATVNGIGDVRLRVNQELDATINGIGSIFYKGQPNVQQSINGIGKVIDAN